MIYSSSSCLFLLLSLVSIISAAPVTNQLQHAERFLQECGYLANVAEEDQHYNDDIIMEALVRFQEDAGLLATGISTEETWQRIGEEESSCSVAVTERKRRSIAVENAWDSHDITWDVSSYSKWLSKSQVDDTAEQALKMWSDAADITFIRVPGGVVDIEIAFVEGAHGDVDFGGTNIHIAHSFYPPTTGSTSPSLDGDVHLDDAVEWTVESSEGNSLLVNLAHELGHSIGISQSTNNKDVMHNPPPAYDPSLTLSENDKAAARQLYGTRTSEPPVVNPEPATQVPAVITPKATTPSQPNDKSTDSNCLTSIDAATEMLTGEIILIQGNNVWKMVNNQLVNGYPVQVSTVFPGLPANVDSALTIPPHTVEWGDKAGKTYFFKGAQLWRYTGFSPDTGYPLTLQQEFGVSLSHVDAAFTLGGLRGVYFIAGTDYYLKTPYQEVGRPWSGHILYTSSFAGFNTQATAALSGVDDIMYLFGADGNYYKINPLPASDWSVVPGFPRPTSTDWFGCDN